MKIKKLGITPTQRIKALGIEPVKGVHASRVSSIHKMTKQAQNNMDFLAEKKKAVNTITSEVKTKFITNKTQKSVQGDINVSIGLFFDGTGNNRFASELVYYNDMFWDKKTMQIKGKELKNKSENLKKGEKTSPIPFKNILDEKYKFELEKHMLDEESAPSYLNPYSNIVLLHDIYPEQKYDSKKPEIILKQYIQGIGTLVKLQDDGITPKEYYSDDVMGSSSGRGQRGVIARVEQGLYAIAEKIKREIDDNNLRINILSIDIFGFSRGAAAARHCVNELMKEKTGLSHYDYGVFGSYLDYMNITFPKKLDIRFIGLFDTVISDTSYDENINLSIPKKLMIELPELFQHPANVFYEEFGGNYGEIKTSLKNTSAKVMHIIAMDEYRKNFPLTICDAPNKYNLYLYGSHSDIGGGYAESSYKTLVEFDMVANNDNKLDKFKKVAKSFENKFAYESYNGKWILHDKQVQILQGEKKYSKPRINSNQPPVFLGYDYEMYDERFITNKIYLVSLNAMKQYARKCGVPFPNLITKDQIPRYSDIRFYELPPDKSYLQRYNDGVQKMINDSQNNLLRLSAEDYFNLYHNCIHISANYNRSILGKEAAKNLPVLFINLPTKDKRRKYLNPQ